MAITLAQAKQGMADKVDIAVIDKFQRSSYLLNALVFDDAVSPGTGGSTLTYGYMQLKTPSTAAKRAINGSYTAGEAIKEKKTVDLCIMGGEFELDRVIINTSGAMNELAFQTEQKVKATSNYFHYVAINGVKATDGFDGLKTLLASTENEFTTTVDVSTSALLTTNGAQLLDEIDALVSSIDGGADVLLMNSDMLTKVRGAARRAGYYTRSEDSFGNPVEKYNNAVLVDAGKYFNGTNNIDVIPTDSSTKKTAIYAVRIGLDGFCGVTLSGSPMISAHMPDMNAPGTVKKGDVELVAAVALKNTKAAGVLKGITIKA